MLTGNGHAQVLRDLNDARCFRGGSVAVSVQKVAAHIAWQDAHEISHKDEGPAQNPDDVDGSWRHGKSYLLPKHGHARGNLGGSKELTDRSRHVRAMMIQPGSYSRVVSR
jgi:hypothetical protein